MVLGEQFLDRIKLALRYFGDNEMLVGRQAEATLVDLGNLTQGGLEIFSWLVLHTSIFDEASKVMLPLGIRDPSKLVHVADKVERFGGLECESLLFLDCSLENI